MFSSIGNFNQRLQLPFIPAAKPESEEINEETEEPKGSEEPPKETTGISPDKLAAFLDSQAAFPMKLRRNPISIDTLRHIDSKKEEEDKTPRDIQTILDFVNSNNGILRNIACNMLKSMNIEYRIENNTLSFNYDGKDYSANWCDPIELVYFWGEGEIGLTEEQKVSALDTVVSLFNSGHINDARSILDTFQIQYEYRREDVLTETLKFSYNGQEYEARFNPVDYAIEQGYSTFAD